MPSLVENLANTVIFLFEEKGEVPIGTGFVIGYPVPTGGSSSVVPMIVTAKHVVGGENKILGRFSGKSAALSAFAPYDLQALRRDGDLWVHPDDGVDLVVFRTPAFENVEHSWIPIDAIASREDFTQDEIKPTDRVVFPCLLVNFMGTTRNFPVVRDGMIAQIPNEPVSMSYTVASDKIATKQPVILIDATSIQGASGSPIFLWPGSRIKAGQFTSGGRAWLIGIMHGFFLAQPRELTDMSVTKVGFAFQENSGIALATPSWRLLEILDQRAVKERISELTAKG